AVRPFAFSATARPPQAEPISTVGTIGSASVSPSQPDQPPPRGRPELAGKPCFPAEVPSKPPEIPAQNSPSLFHQIDRAPGARQDCKRDLRRVKVARTICEWTFFHGLFYINELYRELDDVYGHPVRFQLVSALDLPHEFRGRSNRECQDLRFGRLGVPRLARIAARLTLCPRDLPGLRIRLTTVLCILPERLELTWCHRGICRRDRLIIVP
ncbi:F-box family protein with DUF295, partial [Prunus dulcis]